jgi:hypothetical protein
MGIFKKDKEVTAIYIGKKAISAVYRGAKLVWEAIRSCFGNGYWVNSLPWDNADSWKNNS